MNHSRLPPFSASEFIQHRSVNGVDDTCCQVCWQSAVVAFIEGDISELFVLHDVLIEVAVQCTALGEFQGLEIAAVGSAARCGISNEDPPRSEERRAGKECDE